LRRSRARERIAKPVRDRGLKEIENVWSSPHASYFIEFALTLGGEPGTMESTIAAEVAEATSVLVDCPSRRSRKRRACGTTRKSELIYG
jgi:hypothetical protein